MTALGACFAGDGGIKNATDKTLQISYHFAMIESMRESNEQSK